MTGSFALTHAVLKGYNQRLKSSISPYINGNQLPNVPAQELSLTEDWGWRDGEQSYSRISSLSGNNEQNLPPYILLTAGMERRLSDAAMITIVATNVTHEYTGLFISSANAIPLATRGGNLPTLAVPLPQARLTADLRFHW